MREITFRRLPGMAPGSETISAPLHIFLLEIPNLFHFGYIPPLEVINAYLAEGRSDAGMSGGCEWTPFALSEDEYAEVVQTLRQGDSRQRGAPLRSVDVPRTITRKNEWAAWVFHQEVGIPFEEHLHLTDREEILRLRAQEAAERGDDDAVILHLEWQQAAMELVEFCQPYLNRYREQNG
ncbi:MAG TPA: hypothetical protein VNZ55_12510 [Thermomicrobiales bacterium]|nr:hypothetical protein [Thermomicrobiales bacterium]